uniref:Uncharacterized protein n=1 Tax=Corethron hystrix TaxID=216773 RepID=A0A7S1FWF7_9STRA|mmetsp:Transcript_36137/g.84458  ORF Transcript_36137/g.84458 Transcript_36137/m.84458 type:complete len:212 (+) Transcript_36137:717-1352(+)
MPPLESVDGPQISRLPMSQPHLLQKLLAPVPVPDMDVLRRQLVRVRTSPQEPQELLRHSPPERAFGGEQRQRVVAKGEAHLHAEGGERAGSRPVPASDSVGDDGAAEGEVLGLLGVGIGRGRLPFLLVGVGGRAAAVGPAGQYFQEFVGQPALGVRSAVFDLASLALPLVSQGRKKTCRNPACPLRKLPSAARGTPGPASRAPPRRRTLLR